MNPCLLCQSPSQSQLSFQHLFLLKRDSPGICPACWALFEELSQPGCPTCCKVGEEDSCNDCGYWKSQGLSVRHRSLYHYTAAMKAYFSQYKFQGDYLLRSVFAQPIRSALKPYLKKRQLIPLPVSPERFSERGFNQVTGLLEAAGLPYYDCLAKKETGKQSDKTRAERLKLAPIFYLKEGQTPAPSVLLVDDIYTTGATLQAAKAALETAGVTDIRTFSLAR